MHDEDVEEPASVIVTNSLGQGYDIKNIPGAKRKQLIESGEMSIDTFVNADNMPGAKLQKMRDRFKASVGMKNVNPKEVSKLDINSLEPGTLVNYRGTITEVRKINVDKGLVSIKTKENKVVWVNVAKLKEVNLPNKDED